MRTRISSPELQELEVVSTWKILLSISVMTTVSLLVLVLFSDTVDTGREVVNGLLEYAAAGASTSVFACMCVVALVLYVCDISYWSGTIGALARRIMLLLLALATYAFGLSMVRTHPYFPLTLFIFTLPLASFAQARWSRAWRRGCACSASARSLASSCRTTWRTVHGGMMPAPPEQDEEESEDEGEGEDERGEGAWVRPP